MAASRSLAAGSRGVVGEHLRRPGAERRSAHTGAHGFHSQRGAFGFRGFGTAACSSAPLAVVSRRVLSGGSRSRRCRLQEVVNGSVTSSTFPPHLLVCTADVHSPCLIGHARFHELHIQQMLTSRSIRKVIVGLVFLPTAPSSGNYKFD